MESFTEKQVAHDDNHKYRSTGSPCWTLSRTNWKHFCLTLTRISASAAPANLGYISVIIIIIFIIIY